MMSFLYGMNDTAQYKYSVSANYSQEPLEHGMHANYTQLDFSYYIFKGLSCGVYTGYYEQEFFFSKFGHLLFGVNADIFILPLFFDREEKWFNPYVPINVGNAYIKKINLKWFEEYNFGIGLEVSPLERLSCHIEYNYGKVFSIKNERWLLGVSFKF